MINAGSFFSSRSGNGASTGGLSITDIVNAVWAGSVNIPAATKESISNAVWGNTTKKLSADGAKEIAIAHSKFGYQTDVVTKQMIQLDENGVEVARFNCFDENGAASLTSIKRMVAV